MTSISAPLWLSGVRLRSTSRLTSAIEASASPRKPSVPTRNRSSASAILLVAWLARASGSSSGGMPPPLSTTRTISSPPCSTETSIRVAPASTAFSINSLTTLAGRSITSPAAILFTTESGTDTRLLSMLDIDMVIVGTRLIEQVDRGEGALVHFIESLHEATSLIRLS